VELADREVRHLVAEDLAQESVRGPLEVGGDANEPSVRIAAAERRRETRAPLDAAPRVEVGDVPEVEPAVEACG
jgi:hypothetical protein